MDIAKEELYMDDKNKNDIQNDNIIDVNNIVSDDESAVSEVIREIVPNDNEVSFTEKGEYRYIPKNENVIKETKKEPARNEIVHRLPSPRPHPTKEAFYKETIKNDKKKRRGSSFSRWIAACLIISIAGGGSIGAGYSFTQNYFESQREVTETVATPSEETNKPKEDSNSYIATSVNLSDSNTSVQIVKEVFPSVVSITTKVSGSTNYYNAFNIPYESSGAGSGVIFHEDDTKIYIATNDHVIEGANEIGISMSDSINTVPAAIVGKDNTADLAVISVLKKDLESAGIADIKVAKFGNSNDLEVGESVIAIGNALGEGKTSTGGMISALGREITIDGKTLQVIQTDAAINPGNSGGALVNYKGEVIGINTAKAYESSVEGMGYAIPSNVVVPAIEKLLTNGTAERPFLGIVGTNINDEMAELYGLPVGALVREVVPGGTADKAGVKANDIITGLGGETIMDMDSLVTALAKQKVGDKIEIRIIRGGNTAMRLKAVIQDANNQ